MVVVLDGIGRFPGRNGTETRERMSRLSKQKRLGNLPSLRRQFTLPQMLLLLRGRGLALVFLVLLRHRRFGLIRRDSRLRSIGSDDW